MNGTVKGEKGTGRKDRKKFVTKYVAKKFTYDLKRGKDTSEFVYTNKKGGPRVLRVKG